MSNIDNEPSPGEAAAQAFSGLSNTIRKGIDRVGFEADKLMRSNRIRSETQRLQRQSSKLMSEISEKVLELEAEGAEMEPSLQALITQVRSIRKKLADKATEVEQISKEVWIEPPPDGEVLEGQATPIALPPGKPPARAEQSRPEKPRTKLCPNCNGPLRPMSVFCPNCGFRLE